MTWINTDSVLDQLYDAGLIIKGGLQVGTPRPIRCRVDGRDKEKRGWYWLDEIWLDHPDGGKHAYIVGAFGVYHGNDNGKQAISLAKDLPKPTTEQKRAIAERKKQQQERMDAIRKAEINRAAYRASAMWGKCLPTGESDYLKIKAVDNFGCRFTDKGALVVPLLDANSKIYGLQFIGESVKAKFKDRNKTFTPSGFEKKSHWHMHGVPQGVILISEGYATFASGIMATGICSVMAFDAGNILPVAKAIRKAYPGHKILILADDDNLQKCVACGQITDVNADTCTACGQPHGKKNAGVYAAIETAIALPDCKWLTPAFKTTRQHKQHTDFNDLHREEGLHTVKAQIESKLQALDWLAAPNATRGGLAGGGGDGARLANGLLKPLLSVDEVVKRYTAIYPTGTMFDHALNCIVGNDAVKDIMVPRGWDDLKRNPGRRVVSPDQVDFDPAGEDPNIVCNLFRGFPKPPKSGACDALLDLLEYLCNPAQNGPELYQYVLNWLATPLQKPGVKMKTALVFHGPQGTGKNTFFEAYAAIYGDYARVINQSALEDKHNDWQSGLLFALADEVVSRQEFFHMRNKVKDMITGDTIRINPKNIAARWERNRVNIVFSSNEKRPIDLDPDDRRFWVIMTPDKATPGLYEDVYDEIANGGIAALHHYLLHRDLGDFKPWTQPVMTQAKQNLIDLSYSPTERFWRAWVHGDIDGVPVTAVRSADLFNLFRHWCQRVGIYKHPPQHILDNQVRTTTGVVCTANERYTFGGVVKQARFILPPGVTLPPGKQKQQWFGECVEDFNTAVTAWLA